MLSSLVVWLSFNIKMLETYVVLPAFALVYLLDTPRSLRLLHLALGGMVLLVASCAWMTIVDTTASVAEPGLE